MADAKPIKVRIVLEDSAAWSTQVAGHLVRLPSYTLCNLVDLAADTGSFGMGKTAAKRAIKYGARYAPSSASYGRDSTGSKPSKEFKQLAAALLASLQPEQIIEALMEIQYTPSYLKVVAVS
jgi:hypothetical protein